MDRNVLEQILNESAIAPRVTLAQVEANIASVRYFTARQGVEGTYEGGVDDECIEDAEHLKLLTFCVIVAKNGFTFTDSSACAYPENFNPEIGKKIAYDRAFNKMWAPMGYMLKQAWFEAQQGVPPQETSWQDRLKSEAFELSAKIDKLRGFIDAGDVDGIDKTLLIQQKNSMLEYLEILADRMLRAGIV